MILDRCSSTNDVAREAAEKGAPHGSWISAGVQDSARGRLGRKWESLEGNLFLSMILRVDDQRLWSWLPLTVAVGTATAVIRTLGPLPGLKIKWPNDLWITGGQESAKVGGILCEGHARSGNSFVIAGLGLNCAVSPDPRALGGLRATSLSEVLNRQVVADDLREAVVAGILEWVEKLAGPESAAGLRDIREFYETRALFAKGSRVQWGGHETGTVVGLGESGELVVRNSHEELQSLLAEDVKVRL